MGTKLSVTTRAWRLPLRLLAITAMLVGSLAISASGASAAKRYGVWTVRPGWTLHLTDMEIEAARGPVYDVDTAFIYIDGSLKDTLGSNAGSPLGGVALDPYSYTNTTPNRHTVTLDLHGSTPPCDSFSNGPDAVAITRGVGLGLFAITDGSAGGCGTTPIGLGGANFFGNESITRTP